tara:strand:- start:163 stop:801 length:639 start_codon:yes stop_codon:yes gene_type:complete
MLEFSPLCLARLHKDDMFSAILDNVDSVHLDIMDGDFVPNTAFSVSEINEFTCSVPKHVHIMSWDPMVFIKDLINVDSISFHCEVDNCGDIIKNIKAKGINAGLVINPNTPIDTIFKYIDQIHRVIIMAVEPGYSAQKYLPLTSKKISDLREFSPDIEISIDGGMNETTISHVKELGANAFVVCSVIAKSNNVQEKIKELQSIWNNNIDSPS